MLEVLSAEGAGASRWTALIEGLPADLRDIHFLPEYGCIYRDSYGFEPVLAVDSGDDGYLLQAFVRRPLGGLPFLAGSGDTASDLANPYGFGGPLASGEKAGKRYARFAAGVTSWCEREGIASEFCSLHPFLAAHQRELLRGVLKPRHEKDVVYIDLSRGEAGIVAGLNRGHRSSVSKARRNGVRVDKVEPTAANVAVLNEIYHSTMKRQNAAARWFMPERFFADTLRHLGPQRSALFFARVGEQVECAYLLMHAYGTAYYHFAGTRDAYPELRASNLTMVETAAWAARQGCARYHLGGGVSSSAQDSLLRFKAGFSALRAPLYTYFCVRDALAYDRLCERKRAHERAAQGREIVSDFLPLYRR